MKVYEVFVSSPQKYFIEERLAVINSILRSGHMPRAMEYFPASHKNSWDYIKSVIDKCDYYILILAASYGSISKDSNIGFTEREYRYALKKKIPTIAFLHQNRSSLPYDQHDHPEKLTKLYEFAERHLCKYWNEKNPLTSLISDSLNNLISDFPRPGLTRMDTDMINFNNHEASEYISNNVLKLLKLPYRENVTADVKYEYHTDINYLSVTDVIFYNCRSVNGLIDRKVIWSLSKEEFNLFQGIEIEIKKPSGEKKLLFKRSDFVITNDENEDFLFEHIIDKSWAVDGLLVHTTAKYLVLRDHFISWEMPVLSFYFSLTVRFPNDLQLSYMPYLLTYLRGEHHHSDDHFTYKFFDWVLPNEGLTWQFKKKHLMNLSD